MNKKKEDLEAIADLLYEWCIEYNEPYVSVWARHESGNDSATAIIDSASPDCSEIDLRKKYETPAAGTAGESE